MKYDFETECIYSIRTLQGPIYWNGWAWTWDIKQAKRMAYDKKLKTMPFDIVRCYFDGVRID